MDVPVEVLRATDCNDGVGICEAGEDSDPVFELDVVLVSLLRFTHSLEFSNCARTAMMCV
jgi:hypothetical protein